MTLVTFERFGHVAVITLNRPEARNAINLPMAEAIGSALDEYESDPHLHAAVLAAAVVEPRPIFCAGDDLHAINDAPAVTQKGGFAGIIDYPRSKPLIAAVDGLATSGGCEIVLSCDMVVASERSTFALAEIKWNLVALAGGVIRLPRLIGRAPALDMILTGQPISAERAYDLGLVSTLTDQDPVEVALERAQMIAQFDPETVRFNLALATTAATQGESELWEENARTVDAVFSSEALARGLAEFTARTRG